MWEVGLDHYNSWKNYKSKKIIIKYEDMVNKSNINFFKSFKLSFN